MFGAGGSRTAPRPLGFTGDRAYYYLCLAVVGLAIVGVQMVRRARLGQLLRAMADSSLVLSTNGANVNITRVLAFCLSAFLAAVAGALFAAQAGSVNGLPFTALNSLLWLAVLVIAGPGEISSVVGAAVLLVVVPSYATSPGYIEAQPVLFGVMAVAAALRSAGGLRLSPSVLAAARGRAQSSLAATRPVAAVPVAAEGVAR
jgi:ABC-type branched-subunit amino acid transport system permease subunit